MESKNVRSVMCRSVTCQHESGAAKSMLPSGVPKNMRLPNQMKLANVSRQPWRCGKKSSQHHTLVCGRTLELRMGNRLACISCKARGIRKDKRRMWWGFILALVAPVRPHRQHTGRTQSRLLSMRQPNGIHGKATD
eukprot:366226-Chlamydomonas_euryale.AAC.16